MDFYKELGLKFKKEACINAEDKVLVEKAVSLGHGELSKNGSLVVKTGSFTGRAAKDKYVVKTQKTEKNVWWENALREMSTETFNTLKTLAVDYLNEQTDIFITERSVGAHKTHNVGARLITSRPSAALFSNHLFRDKIRELNQDDFTILHVPGLEIDPEKFQELRSNTVITTCFEQKITIIIGKDVLSCILKI